MATKTINLTGAEVAVTGLDGAHAHIRNDGTEVIYAAKTAGITAGADGVVPIPAGNGNTLRGISGAVYLLGTGSVLIQSDDYVASPFKTAAQAGGSGADDVARAAISTHAGNDEIHVTAAEKASWNGKAEISDIPATLPANGGNAQALIDYNSTDVRLMLGWRGSPLDSTDYLAGYDRSELESNGIVKIKEFPVSKLPLREGNMYLDIFSTSLSSNHACWNKNCYVTGQSANADSEDYIENAPEITGHQLWYEVFTCGHRMRAYQIAFGCYNWQNNVFIRFKHDDTWSEWANVSDGGNADSVGAYTEAKLAALEARIAALEGGTT